MILQRSFGQKSQKVKFNYGLSAWPKSFGLHFDKHYGQNSVAFNGYSTRYSLIV